MNKEFYRSKTFWAAILGIAGAAGAYLSGSADLTTTMTTIAGFTSVFGLRDSWK